MQSHSADSNPEELLDVFKAAALSVTRLFKTSTAAQSKARVDGYQDCLEDLLAVIDKGDADVRSIRRWIQERLDGRESILSTVESEDEVEKTDSGSTPEPNSARHAAAAGNTSSSTRASANASTVPAGTDTEMDTETETLSPIKIRVKAKSTASASPATSTASTASAPTLSSTASAAAMAALAAKKAAAKTAKARANTSTSTSTSMPASTPAPAPATASDSTGTHEMAEAADAPVPVQMPESGTGGFSFRSAVPYPTDSFLELANLDLSDRRSAPGTVKEQAEVSAFASAPPNTQAPSSTTFIFNAPGNSNSENTAVSTPARQFRVRHGAARTNGRNILTARYNRSSAGQKRKLNFDEIFDVASLGYGKDVFSRGGPKRSRQT